MANIGSVFLGDFQRHRILSTTTSSPPSSPPPSSISGAFPSPHSPSTATWPVPELAPNMTDSPKPLSRSTINPDLALDLRIRWLEAIMLGVNPNGRDGKGKDRVQEMKSGESLTRMAEDVQKKLNTIIEGNDGLNRFINHYDQHAHLLTPSFALSGTLPDPPLYENMSPEELDAFLTEMEPDIRAADRDMREIEVLERKGVTGAGKLTDHEALQPRLDALLDAYEKDLERATSLEKRVASLMERHATHVDALSELFVSWDETLTVAEDKVALLEREREGRRRLGLE